MPRATTSIRLLELATLTNSAFVVSPRGDVKKKLTILNNLTGSNDITVNAAASRAVTAGRDNAAAVFDLKSGFRLAYLRGHSDWVAHVLFSPDGKWIVWGSNRSNPEGRDTNLFIARWVE